MIGRGAPALTSLNSLTDSSAQMCRRQDPTTSQRSQTSIAQLRRFTRHHTRYHKRSTRDSHQTTYQVERGRVLDKSVQTRSAGRATSADMDWRQTTLLSWLSRPIGVLVAGTSTDNPIEILDEDDDGADASDPITISDSEDDNTDSRDIDGNRQPPNWPLRVPYWTTNRGLRNARFPDINLGPCKCTRVCTVSDCDNAGSAIFCDNSNCNAGPSCGNRLLNYHSLVLSRCIKGLGVTTTSEIPPLTVIGEYCGYIIPRAKLTVSQRDRGFVLKFKSKDTDGARVFLDAYSGGSLCRFVNHSCSPNSRLEERSHRTTRRMVVITQRQIHPGEEITVLYNKRVTFTCLCGETNCQSKRNS